MTTTKRKRKAVVDTSICVSCGECAETCPRYAITIACGSYSRIDHERCVGCGACAVVCPASAIRVEEI